MEDAMRTTIPLTVLATALACSFASAPAHARARVFVASYGNDANACTFGSPCKTFQQAVNVVDPGGEVTAIDSAGFGPINISQSVTITSPPGVEAGIVPNSAIAININAGLTDVVSLRGLTIDGSTGASIGINVASVAVLNIQDTVIRNFTVSGSVGINFEPTAASMVVSNTVISNNFNYGIHMLPGTSSLTSTVTLSHVQVDHSASGVSADGSLLVSGGQLFVVLADSVVSDCGRVDVESTSAGQPTNMMVKNSTLVHGGTGAIAAGVGAFIRLNQSTIAHNRGGWHLAAGGIVTSYGNNAFDDNGGNEDSAPPANPLK
jgi:hypothetical protein